MPSGFHNWSATAANNDTADSSINWAEGQAPSSINDSARVVMAVLAKWRDDNNGSLTTGGTSTAYTLTTNTVFTSLALMDNQTLAFTTNATSGATPTLNVDGLGAKVIRNATGVALPTGALLSGSVYKATYDNGAGEWLLHNQPGVLPTNVVSTATIVDEAVTYAKIQNVSATSRLLGRSTAGAGDIEEITLGAGVSMSGGALVSTLDPAVIPGFLSGVELSYSSTTAIGITAGGANDVASGGMMTLAAAITKTTSAWAVGTGNGGLDTGAIATNTWYHFYLIKRPDTGVVDVLFSTSVSSPTMPSNYTLKRRIGSARTNGSSQWTQFTQTGDQFIWLTGILDINTATTTSRVLSTVSVPTGVAVEALTRVSANGGGGGSTFTFVVSPLENDAAPSSTNATIFMPTSSANAGNANVMTNTSAQVAVRSNNTNGTLSVTTYGWNDRRGK